MLNPLTQCMDFGPWCAAHAQRKRPLKVGAASSKGRTVRSAEVTKEHLAVEIGYRAKGIPGKQSHGSAGKWTAECTRIISEHKPHLVKFDQLREGAYKVQGQADYAVNPLKIQCMLQGCNQDFRMGSHLSSCSQIRHSQRGN